MDYQQLLHEKGISLEALGVRERALGRADAVTAVQLLSRAGIPILGGDVYLKRQGEIRLAYANWHVDHGDGDDEASYRKRTWNRALEYIREYPEPANKADSPIFVIVAKR